MRGFIDVPDVRHVMAVGKHHDFVGMGRLALVADGALG
jgi:hypothetical protein